MVLESNHDVDMLHGGPYPYHLKRRIASRHGHLSNADAGKLVSEVAHRGLQQLVLAHLSETNNDHGVARTTVSTALGRTRFRGTVSTAAQHGPVGPFCAKHSRSARVEQLALGL